MTAIPRVFAIGLALLLTAAPAVADTVVTTSEVIPCSVERLNADSIYVKPTRPRARPRSTRERYEQNREATRSRALPTHEVYELRLSDSGRAAELAGLLPLVRVIVDSAQPVPPTETRMREMVRFRLEQARTAQTCDFPGPVEILDTLSSHASRRDIAAKCQEMAILLQECGSSAEPVSELLGEIDSEAAALDRIQPDATKYICCAPAGGLLGASAIGLVGAALGLTLGSQQGDLGGQVLGGLAGMSIGLVIGALAGLIPGAAAGHGVGEAIISGALAERRVRVNQLVRRANQVLAGRQ